MQRVLCWLCSVYFNASSNEDNPASPAGLETRLNLYDDCLTYKVKPLANALVQFNDLIPIEWKFAIILFSKRTKQWKSYCYVNFFIFVLHTNIVYWYNDKYYVVEEKRQEVFINFLFFSPRNKVEIKICNKLSFTEKILESRHCINFFPQIKFAKIFYQTPTFIFAEIKKSFIRLFPR